MGLLNIINNNGSQVANTMSAGADRYQSAINDNTGLNGFQEANKEGLLAGAKQAEMAGQIASSQVPEITRSGMSKSMAGIQGARNTVSQVENGMSSGYSSGYSNKSNDMAVRTNIILRQNSLANEAAKTQFAASQARLAQAQSMLSGALSLARSTGIGQAVKDSFTSDEKSKDLTPATTEDALRQIESIIYKYTPEAQAERGVDGDVHVGVTAQSVEKGFPEAVTEVNGMKELDKQKLLEAVMAGIAALQKELDE